MTVTPVSWVNTAAAGGQGLSGPKAAPQDISATRHEPCGATQSLQKAAQESGCAAGRLGWHQLCFAGEAGGTAPVVPSFRTATDDGWALQLLHEAKTWIEALTLKLAAETLHGRIAHAPPSFLTANSSCHGVSVTAGSPDEGQEDHMNTCIQHRHVCRSRLWGRGRTALWVTTLGLITVGVGCGVSREVEPPGHQGLVEGIRSPDPSPQPVTQPDPGVSDPNHHPVVYYYALAYAPERNRLAVAGDGGVMIFDGATAAKLKTIDPGPGAATLVRQAGDVMAAALLRDLWIYDAAGKKRRTIKHPDQVYSLDLSADGATVLTGCVDGRVRRFRTADGSEITPALRLHNLDYGREAAASSDFVNDVAVAPDGLYLAAATVEGTHLWRAADGALVARLPDEAHRVAFAPDGREIAIVTDRDVATYTVPALRRVRSYSVAGVTPRLAYSSDGRRLAVSSGHNRLITIFDTDSGAATVTLSDESELRFPEQSGFRDVSEMAFVDNDRRLAVAWRSGRLAQWRTDDGVLILSRLDHDAP